MVRPIKPGSPGTKTKLGIDVTGAMKNRIDAAARASGHSQGREITERLNWSFDAETRVGGKRALEMAMLLASAASVKYGSNWPDDEQCYDSVKKLFGDLLEAVRPAAAPEMRELTAKIVRAQRKRFAEITDPEELERQLDWALQWGRRMEEAIDESVDEMLRPVQQQVDEVLLAPVRQLMHEQFAELYKQARQRISASDEFAAEAATAELLAAPMPLFQSRRHVVELPRWLLVSLRAATASRLGVPPALFRPFRRKFFQLIDQLGKVGSADEQLPIHLEIEKLFDDLVEGVLPPKRPARARTKAVAPTDEPEP
jgi:hypothetical protein